MMATSTFTYWVSTIYIAWECVDFKTAEKRKGWGGMNRTPVPTFPCIPLTHTRMKLYISGAFQDLVRYQDANGLIGDIPEINSNKGGLGFPGPYLQNQINCNIILEEQVQCNIVHLMAFQPDIQAVCIDS